jgi:hypothetical protein
MDRMSNRQLLSTLKDEGIAVRKDADGWYWEHQSTGDESGYPRYTTMSQAAIEAALRWDIEVNRTQISQVIDEQLTNDGADPGDDNDFLSQYVNDGHGKCAGGYEGSWDDIYDAN